MMIKYESKISFVLNILKYVVCLPAIAFIILYRVKNNELFLTLTFVCMASCLLFGGLANLLEIKHCLRKEEKSALKVMGLLSVAGFLVFFILIISRII